MGNSEEIIFIVGYPKSGTTWLTRLMARILDSKVIENPENGSFMELASYVNSSIKNKNTQKYILTKKHIYPNELSKFTKSEKPKIIFINRDPADVFISSFFYFNKGIKEKYFNLSFIQKLNPISYYKWKNQTKKLEEYLQEFIGKGSANGKHGTFRNFNDEWVKYSKSNENVIFVKYENLMNSPVENLQNIVKGFGAEIETPKIIEAVSEENFSKRKKEILKDNERGYFNKEFRKKFLRSGKIGDGKKHLSKDQFYLLQKEAFKIEE